MNSHKKRHNFEWNSKYFTISVYSIFVILAGCIRFRLILNLAATLEVIRHFLGVMSPFLIGLLIAYMMNPFINLFYYSFFKRKLNVKRKKLFKLISIVISYIIVFGILGTCLTFVIPQLVESITELIGAVK